MVRRGDYMLAVGSERKTIARRGFFGVVAWGESWEESIGRPGTYRIAWQRSWMLTILNAYNR